MMKRSTPSTLTDDVSERAGGAAIERGPAHYLVLGLSLAATVVVTAMVTRTARCALRQAAGE